MQVAKPLEGKSRCHTDFPYGSRRGKRLLVDPFSSFFLLHPSSMSPVHTFTTPHRQVRFSTLRPSLHLSDLDQNCKDFIGAERFCGRFKRGGRHGGVGVTSCGTLVREVWQRRENGRRKAKALQPLQRVPLFSCEPSSPSHQNHQSPSSSHSDEERLRSTRRSERVRERVRRSRITSMSEWTVREVQYFCACLGIGGAALACRLEKHAVNGDVLLSIAENHSDLVKELFPLDPGCRACPQMPGVSARHRILIANVDFFRRALQKEKEPQPTEDDLKAKFSLLQIPKDDLQLTGYIGEGGFSRVYSGLCRNVRVAAKSTEGVREKKELTNQISSKRVPVSFYNEIHILHRLQEHPNFPVLIGYSLPHNIIVMELVPGQSLHDLLHSRKRRTFLSIYRECDFGYRDILHVAKEICNGMAYMHALNIVHCDIKTMNILVSNHQPAPDRARWSCLPWVASARETREPLSVKIVDFGFAQDIDVEETSMVEDFCRTVHVGCLGTYQYMAPEVFRAEGYCKASDVYSFGMVLWEMIANRVPFQDYTAFQVMAQVGFARKLPEPPEICPLSLQKLLYSALRVEPRERQRFLDLAEQCKQLLTSRSVEIESMFWNWLALV